MVISQPHSVSLVNKQPLTHRPRQLLLYFLSPQCNCIVLESFRGLLHGMFLTKNLKIKLKSKTSK